MYQIVSIITYLPILYILEKGLHVLIQKADFPREKTMEFTTKMISIIHSIGVSYGSMRYFTGYTSLENIQNYTNFTLGYLLFDMIIQIINYKKFRGRIMENLLHHVLLYILVMYVRENYMLKLYSLGILCELTNIPLYLGWYLIQIRKQHTIYFKINGILLLFTFYILRIVNFGFISYRTITILPLKTVIIFNIIYGLNIYWFVLLGNKLKQSIYGKIE